MNNPKHRQMSKKVIFILSMILCSCSDLVQDADIEIPSTPPRLVLEFYLSPGETPKAILTESLSYFDTLEIRLDEIELSQLIELLTAQGLDELIERLAGIRLPKPFVNDANFKFYVNDKEYTLSNQLELEVINSSQSGPPFRLYNYVLDQEIDFNTQDNYKIRVEAPGGRVITGETKFLETISVDSLQVDHAGEKAQVVAYFEDPQPDKNFFRLTAHNRYTTGENERDVTINDNLQKSTTIALTSGFDFFVEDTCIVTLYHIDESYYDFVVSASRAFSSNFNPFAEPSGIFSNIEGGIGVFTALSTYRDTLIIPEP